MNILQNSYSNDYFQLQTTLVCIPFFLLGWLIKKNDLLLYANKQIVKFRPLITIALIGGILLGFYNGMVNALTCHVGKSIVIYYIVGFFVSASLMWLCSVLFVVKPKIIQSISEGTILILAVHLTMIDGLKHVLQLSMNGSVVASFLIMFICVILSILAKQYFPVLLGKKNYNE